jgi:hypothetical protein
VGLVIFGLTRLDERAWLSVAVIFVLVFGFYFVSYYFAKRKFENWIDHLVAKYAAHVARGGK